jgi:biotin carboxylase
MEASKTLLIVGAGLNEVPAIECARQRGLRAIVADGNASAPGLSLADGAAVIDIRDGEQLLALARSHSIAGIMTVSVDAALPAIAYAAEILRLPAPTATTVAMATNKLAQRTRWQLRSVAQPRFIAVKTIDEMEKALFDIGLPAIIKPIDRSAGRGVFKLSHRDDLARGFAHARAASAAEELLLEEYISGSEHSVEAFSINGRINILGISDKLKTPPPHIMDRSLNYPSQLSNARIEAIKQLMEATITSLEIIDGPSHTELIVAENGPRIIESHARCGGGLIGSHILPAQSGVNLVGCVIDWALGNKVDLETKYHRGVVLRFLLAPPGRLRAIDGIDNARADRRAIALWLGFKPGDEIGALSDGTKRAGYIIVADDQLEAAIAAADQLEQQIIFQME